MNKSDLLKSFFELYGEGLVFLSSGYQALAPEMNGLSALDYLEFSEHELASAQTESNERKRASHLLNVTSNLRRAVDSEVACFFQVLGLDNYFKRKNPTFLTRSRFLVDSGLFSIQYLERLQTIREQMDAELELPGTDFLATYHDLVFGFVANLQRCLLLAGHTTLEADVNDAEGYRKGSFSFVYGPAVGKFEVKWDIEPPASEGGEEKKDTEASPAEENKKVSEETEVEAKEAPPVEAEEPAPEVPKKKTRRRKRVEKVDPFADFPHKQEMECSIEESRDFQFFFKTWILASQMTRLASNEYVLGRIKS